MKQKLVNLRVIEAYPLKLPYPGAFHPNVEKKIKEIIEDHFCIHLFSGSSKTGDIRVDLTHKNATENQNVYEFMEDCPTILPRPLYLLLDPDYEIGRKSSKLKVHGNTDSVSGNILAQRLLKQFIYKMNFDVIVWLDQCSPTIPGYSWDYWLVKTGGWKTNRVLNIYTKLNEVLF